MGRACCVLGCPSRGNVPSHQFPKDPALARKWKTMIYSEKVQHLTDEQLNKCAVCYRHFADEDYLVTYRVRKLKRGVAPSLNLPNNLSVDSYEINALEKRTTIEAGSSDIGTNVSIMKVQTIIDEEAVMEMPQTTDIELCSDIQSVKASSSEHVLQYSQDDQTNETGSATEASKLYRNVRGLKRKRAKLALEQLALLRCKKQADEYAKTPTIQKLLSVLTPAQRSSLQSKIRISKYAPKVYIRAYHNIAKRKALGQL